MNAPVRTRMTSEQFLEWETRQERRHELVDGVVRLMAGGTGEHTTIALNAVLALKTRLRGGPCQAFAFEIKVRIPNQNFRYPDVTVDCGARPRGETFAIEPRLVIEVLSPSTEWFDQTKKLEDYQSVPTIQQIAFLAQDRAFARVWSRAGEAWTSVEIDGADGALALTAIDATIAFAEIYDGVTFEPPAEDA